LIERHELDFIIRKYRKHLDGIRIFRNLLEFADERQPGNNQGLAGGPKRIVCNAPLARTGSTSTVSGKHSEPLIDLSVKFIHTDKKVPVAFSQQFVDCQVEMRVVGDSA